jgi:hypothetical protein
MTRLALRVALGFAQARAVPRPDVNAHFKHPEMGAVGFEAFLEQTQEFESSSIQALRLMPTKISAAIEENQTR